MKPIPKVPSPRIRCRGAICCIATALQNDHPGAQKSTSAVRSLFWDHDFSVLDWGRDRELVIGRVLEAGTWDAIQWLRRQTGDAALHDWILRHQGRCLSSEQIRF